MVGCLALHPGGRMAKETRASWHKSVPMILSSKDKDFSHGGGGWTSTTCCFHLCFHS